MKMTRGGGSAARRITLALELGPRKRSVLEALAAHYGGDRRTLDELIARGRVVMIGARKGALYALKGWRDGTPANAR